MSEMEKRICLVERCGRELRSDNKSGACRLHASHAPSSKAKKKQHYEANKEARLSQCREWNRANKDHRREVNNQWRKKNPTKTAEYSKRHWDKNPQKRRDAANQWRLENPEKAKASTDNWRKNHPIQVSSYDASRRNIKKGIDPAGIKAAIVKFSGAPCAFCGSFENPEIDHLVPLSWVKHAEGKTKAYFQWVLGHEWAYQPLCRSHNSSRNRFFFSVLVPTGDIGD